MVELEFKYFDDQRLRKHSNNEKPFHKYTLVTL